METLATATAKLNQAWQNVTLYPKLLSYIPTLFVME